MSTQTLRRPRSGLSLVRQGIAGVAESLVTPLLPADYLDLFSPLRASADLRGRIVAVTPQTDASVTLTIRRGRSWRGHTPGQYVRLGVDIDGVRHWRAYSLTSKTTERTISVTVKAITGGVVSNHLVGRATPGDLVMLDQATGDFVLGAARPAKALFLTAGSGITPVMGMLRNHLAELGDVVVVHSAPTSADVIFGEELRGYAANGRLRLVEIATAEVGTLDLARLAEIVPDWTEREAWTCGPTGLLDAAEAHWAAAGLADRHHVERFRPTVVEPGEGGVVTFARTGRVVDADGATPILDAGEAAGVLMPSGCRMGICFGCVVPMREGAIRDLRTGEVTVVEAGSGLKVQTCVNAVAGACELDL